jgi:large subunit ribosomal protein L24
MAGVRIKKNDTVYVIAGKDRGKSGRVLAVDPAKERVLVEGVNMMKKAVRANPQKNVQGGLVHTEAALHISNVAVLDPETNAPTRVGYKFLEDGSKVRVSRGGAIIEKG